MAIKEALKRADIHDFRINDLRHHFASKAINSGKISIYELQELMGHSTVITTSKYAHLCPQISAKKMVDTLNEINGDVKPELRAVK